MFERFTDRARRALKLAEQEARELRHRAIGTEHLLLGLIHEQAGVAGRALASSGVSLDAARQEVVRMAKPDAVAELMGRPPFTPRAKKVLELSLREALRLDHNYIGTEHLLLGLIREEGMAVQVLAALGVDLASLRANVDGLLEESTGKAGRGTMHRGQRLVRSLWPPAKPGADRPLPAGTVEVSFGRFSQAIADPELAAGLSAISPDQLHASLRQAVLGAQDRPGEEPEPEPDDRPGQQEA